MNFNENSHNCHRGTVKINIGEKIQDFFIQFDTYVYSFYPKNWQESKQTILSEINGCKSDIGFPFGSSCKTLYNFSTISSGFSHVICIAKSQ